MFKDSSNKPQSLACNYPDPANTNSFAKIRTPSQLSKVLSYTWIPGILVLLAWFACGSSALAQNASITGTVTDASGAVIVGANVSAKNAATGAERSVQTAETGAYRIVELQPGLYEVTVSQSGFKSFVVNGLTLNVSQVYTLDAKLEVSTLASSVEVSAASLPTIELDNASLSNVVQQKQIVDLPLVTRDPYQLILLSPGVVQSNANGGFSVNGQRDRNNNFLLDGSDNNDTDVPGGASGFVSLNPDSTQEFRVITNNFLPEYGRNSGAIIDIITKSGTNDLHGSAYWFGRYNALGARDFFNHSVDPDTGQVQPQDPYVRNIFGGSAGGKIVRDKAFWFGNYEGSRFVTTLTNSTFVPTSAFKTGVFTFNGVPVDISSPDSPQNATGSPLDPTIAKILALYPAANAGATAVDDVRGLYNFGSSSRTNADNFTVKVDYNLTPKNILSVRYTYNRLTDPNTAHSDFLPGLDSVGLYARTQSASIGLVSTLRSNLINEFRVGGNRTHLEFTCGGTSTFDAFSTPDSFGRGTDYALAGLNTFGCGTLGDSNGQSRFTGTYNMGDSINWIHGNHSFKIGAQHNRIYSNSFNDFFSRTADSFNVFSTFHAASIDLDPNNPCLYSLQFTNFDAFTARCGSTTLQNMGWMLTGIVDNQFQGQFFNREGTQTANDLRGFRQREFRIYAQDTWKVKPNLTVNYGLAWQYYGVPFEVNNNLSNLFQDPSGFAPFTFSIVGPGTGKKIYKDYYRYYEPRLGIAWDPTKSGRTSLRAGIGVFHDRAFGNIVENARGIPPFEQDFNDFPGLPLGEVGNPPAQTPSPVVQNEAGITPVIFDNNFRNPQNISWNAGVQHELGNLTIEVNYVGSHTSHLFRVVDGNPPQPQLVAQLLQFCSDPGNEFSCDSSTVTGSSLWFGGTDFGNLPFNAVNNNAFFQADLNKSIASATYHALQLNVKQRIWHGLQIQGAYTYSHAIDDASDPLVPAAGNRSFPRNSFNLLAERGNSDFDVRHHGVINYFYELPIGRGKAHLSEGFVGRIFEGWQISGLTTLSTGLPYDIFGNRDNQHTGLSDRLSITGSTVLPPGTDKTQTGPPLSAFSLTPFDSASNLGRNRFYGPGFVTFDAVVEKTTAVTERMKLVFRTEGYNIFNHVAFGQPGNAYANTGTFGISTTATGRADGTTGARQLQFALKLLF